MILEGIRRLDEWQRIREVFPTGETSIGRGPGSPEPQEPLARQLLALAERRLQERRHDAAIKAYEDVLALDRLNHHARQGLEAARAARDRDAAPRAIHRDGVPRVTVDLATLTRQNLDPQEGFVLSRVNGLWDVQSILTLCPMGEDEALRIFTRLLDRRLIEIR